LLTELSIAVHPPSSVISVSLLDSSTFAAILMVAVAVDVEVLRQGETYLDMAVCIYQEK
jgi:hypothetical protein